MLCSAGGRVACGVVVGGQHRPFWLQCLLFDVSQPFLAVFLLLILVARQLARGCLAAVPERCLLFWALQPRATAIFAAVAFAAMSGSY